MYRGAVPNAQRAAVVNGVQIPTYDVMKRNLIAAGFEVTCFSSHTVIKLRLFLNIVAIFTIRSGNIAFFLDLRSK